LTASSPWWQEAVVYQIYPRSYCLAEPDSRLRRMGLSPGAVADRLRDGCGDLAGIAAHLDHIAELGADAIWLSPIYDSPMADFGYDVADYCAISPLFGDLETFDALVAGAHERRIRVILDWVPNHTSDQHPWFRDARSSQTSEHRDFYVWRDPDPADPCKPPNNWKRAFGEGPAWTFDEESGQWYLHLFLPEQPDLDWSNPAVVDAMESVLDFWLARGVDGFRIDVVHALGKPDGLPDVADEQAGIPYSVLSDDPSTHPILRRLRSHVDSWPQEPVLVGEVFLIDAAKVAPYYGRGDELHLAFNFAPMFTKWSAPSFRTRLEEIAALLDPIGAWPTWVLSSHDRPRHRTRYGGSERRARAAAVLSTTVRGTLFLYAGEELGLEDAVVAPDQVVDPGGRDGCRAPIPWTGTSDHGWALEGSEPWLPWPPGADTIHAAAQVAEPGSVLRLYRRLLALRRGSDVLRNGALDIVDAGSDDVLAFSRSDDGGTARALVLVNFSDVAVTTATDPVGRAGSAGRSRLLVAIGSSGEGAVNTEGRPYAGRLGPEEAVVLMGDQAS
jgi:alpha-glucosidase